jgi:hypothetical protein
MKKIILASVSALALFGVAACSDTDGTTTQSVPEPAMNEPATPTTPPAADPAPDAEPDTDDTTTQSITPDVDGADDGAMDEPVDVDPAAPDTEGTDDLDNAQ